MSYIILQDIFYIVLLIVLSIPLGIYIYKIMTGQKVFLTRVLAPVEKGIYKVMGVKSDEEMGAKKYALSALLFSAIGFVFLWILQMLQGFLPFNPEGMKGTSWHLAFNTAASMAKKKMVAVSEGTLSTSNAMFVGLLIGVIFIIGALSFLPAVALGPIADYFTMR